MAIADNGSALMAWSMVTGTQGGTVTIYAQRFDGTAWGPVKQLYTETGTVTSYSDFPSTPVVAMNATGDGVVFFPTFGALQAVRLDGQSGAFSSLIQVSTDTPSYSEGRVLQALLASDGSAYLMDVSAGANFYGNPTSFRVRRLTAGAVAWDSGELDGGFGFAGGGYFTMALDRTGLPMVGWCTSDAHINLARYH
jgi:hypothetical protein